MLTLVRRFQCIHVAPVASRTFAVKELPVQWEYKPNEPSYKPHLAGDLEPFPEPDLDKPIPIFRKFPELLENKDERVKKLLSLRFATQQHQKKTLELELIRKVQRHSLDFMSTEARIAQMTANIRNLQKSMEEFPYNKRVKVNVKELVDKRRKFLKWLRLADYKRFEFVLEQLNIEYKHAMPDGVKLTRKQSLKRQMTDLAEGIRQEKLSTFKNELESQREAFEKEKKEMEEWIRKEEKELGISSQS